MCLEKGFPLRREGGLVRLQVTGTVSCLCTYTIVVARTFKGGQLALQGEGRNSQIIWLLMFKQFKLLLLISLEY
jgi:hypothetical protein